MNVVCPVNVGGVVSLFEVVGTPQPYMLYLNLVEPFALRSGGETKKPSLHPLHPLCPLHPFVPLCTPFSLHTIHTLCVCGGGPQPYMM